MALHTSYIKYTPAITILVLLGGTCATSIKDVGMSRQVRGPLKFKYHLEQNLTPLLVTISFYTDLCCSRNDKSFAVYLQVCI